MISEKAMAPYSSTLAWKIPWTEEPGGLQSMRSLRVGLDWATSLSCIGEGNGNPLQCSCLENPRGRRAWWADIYGVTQSRTRLKWLSKTLISCLGLSLDSSWATFLGAPFIITIKDFLSQWDTMRWNIPISFQTSFPLIGMTTHLASSHLPFFHLTNSHLPI